MSTTKATIRSFQKVLSNVQFGPAASFSETFAQQRFLKKYQEPDSSVQETLTQLCWEEWLEGDESIPQIGLLPSEWYRARQELHLVLGTPDHSEIGFSQGSEFSPTAGKNSLEAKLAVSRWTCTIDAFDEFARICYKHKGLKRAARRRYFNWYRSRGFDRSLRSADRYLWRRFSERTTDVGFSIFKWKLSRVTHLERGSRFGTVPKNNEKRRPINIECFGNIVCQRTLGNWIRAELGRVYNVDLSNLAQIHRHRISDVKNIATIDLKNASDRISLDLCRFLLPNRVLKRIQSSRSEFVLGYDRDYHLIKKVSSMGNGFTFELMSLILTCIARQLDPSATVFGDDIIIERSKATRLIELLESVGLQVNLSKSFTSGPFRESCGANYHLDEGYIESYDFLYPLSIGDCCITYNKMVRLSKIYPSFKVIKDALTRALPTALHGGPNYEFEHKDLFALIGRSFGQDEAPANFPPFFITPKCKGGTVVPKRIGDRLRELCLNPNEFKLINGWEFSPSLRSPTLRHLKPRSHWAKYEMYLSAGRRCKDVLTGEGEWTSKWFVTSGERSFRVATLMT